MDYFNPLTDLKGTVHIIGCGAIGSTVAEMLTRMGIPDIRLYDFDMVTPHNIANQMFTNNQIHTAKTKSLKDLLLSINPEVQIKTHDEGYTNEGLSGYIFLCVDNIDLRRKIAEDNKFNPYIKAMFDFRMRLTDAQHYGADWANKESIKAFIASMQFSHEEAVEATPVSACGTTLNIITTVRLIVSAGLSNFINFVKGKPIKKLILVDSENFFIESY